MEPIAPPSQALRGMEANSQFGAPSEATASWHAEVPLLRAEGIQGEAGMLGSLAFELGCLQPMPPHAMPPHRDRDAIVGFVDGCILLHILLGFTRSWSRS